MARLWHGRWGRRWLQPGSNGRQLDRRVRPLLGNQLPRWQGPSGRGGRRVGFEPCPVLLCRLRSSRWTACDLGSLLADPDRSCPQRDQRFPMPRGPSADQGAHAPQAWQHCRATRSASVTDVSLAAHRTPWRRPPRSPPAPRLGPVGQEDGGQAGREACAFGGGDRLAAEGAEEGALEAGAKQHGGADVGVDRGGMRPSSRSARR
jgi:hypothetical protein